MPVICFEGASAVGKTVTAENLKARCGAFVVPEVNQLFSRPENEAAEWYFERQIERSIIAQEQSRFHRLVILDGDPFQPLWYAWAYDFVGWRSLDFMERFYQPKIQNNKIDFPDLYFVFSASEVELRKRKANDLSRRRRAFETHLKMIEPQRHYFRAMHTFSPDRVFFLEANSIESNVKFVCERALFSKYGESESKILFGKIIQWLRESKA
jgi:deoxyadenosine/deoxycytidine kinase